MASMTDYLEDAIRDHVLLADPYTAPTTLYLALYTSPTTDAGTGSEVTGGSYTRQPVTFTAAATGKAVSATEITFTMPAATVTHAAICDNATGANMLFHGPLTTPKTVAAGADLIFPAGDITATFA